MMGKHVRYIVEWLGDSDVPTEHEILSALCAASIDELASVVVKMVLEEEVPDE
jgi:hypothetical protein